MNKLGVLICLFFLYTSSYAQKYICRTGQISFFSSTPIEDIEAVNNETAIVYDAETHEVVFQLPIKSFKFEKALMQVHFNENYMESNEYPKAEFRGQIKSDKHIDLKIDGSYEVIAEGSLSIHGVTQQRKISGFYEKKGDEVFLSSKFVVMPEDYDIKIPALVKENIANEIEVNVKAKLDKR